MRVLIDAITNLLSSLPARADARRLVSIIPLGSICWEDELPDYRDLAELSEEERNTIWRLFAIRFRVWDSEVLSAEEQTFWDAAQAEVPTWALFQRLVLTADEQEARKHAEAEVEKELEAFFEGANQVELTDKGNGLQEFSATFDLTESPNAYR